MKEVPGAGNNRYREYLRPRPLQHIRQRNCVVHLAMQNQRVRVQCRRDGCHIKPRGRRTHQHQLARRLFCTQGGHHVAGNKRAKGKTGQTVAIMAPIRTSEKRISNETTV